MFKTSKRYNLLKSKKGGIGSIIATIVSIILVLGLISYAVLGQVAGAKDTGEKAQIEQDKINRMLQDPDIVTGNIVKDYVRSGIVVLLGNTAITSSNMNSITDGALYKMSKSYNASGQLNLVSCTQENLSR